MTAVYDVKAQSVQGNCLSCRATVHYRHGGGFPPSRTLALMLLCDSFHGSLSQKADPAAQELVDEVHRALFSAGGMNTADVARFIHCVGVTDHLNCEELEQGEEEQKWLTDLPEATYTISVTDPRFLAHLAPGAEWDTTAFNADSRIAFDTSWRASDVTSLASAISSSQDFSGLPILADALQDAGCDSDELLAHLRDPHATHVRGCWALDLVLGR